MAGRKHRKSGGCEAGARSLLRALAAVFCGAAIGALPALANPLGGTVVGGSATIASTAPGTLTIEQQTPRAAINWQSFNIAPSETTRFVQPSASSIALNRVQAGDPSVIAGKLQANGQLVLVNPSGVVFARGSQVNVNSLIATPSDISTANFMAGKMIFDMPSKDPRAAVVNNGQITVAEKGLAALVGPSVANNGVISARLGQVVLGGAPTWTLDFYGDGLIKFALGSAVTSVPLGADGKPVPSLVSNGGTIDAPGGNVLMTANAAAGLLTNVIDMPGRINAGTYTASSGAATPGSVTLDAGAGNNARLSGTIDVSGLAAGQSGGNAVVTGGSVNLASTARIDARGYKGGGTVKIGGGPHGTDTLVRNALTTNVSAGAVIDASATGSGNGGTVAVWSDGTTIFNGAIYATGGPNGGDGGWVETSGHTLSVGDTAVVVASAANGAAGTWLLDPFNTTISTNPTSNDTCDATVTCTSTGTGANVNNGDIATALNGGTNVTITTGATGSEAGNITVSAPITWSNSNNTLTLDAAGNIAINAAITCVAACGSEVVALNAGGTVTQTAAIILENGTLKGTSVGGATLTNAGNNFGALGPWSNTGGGALAFTNSTFIATGGTISNSAGDITLTQTQATGHITLNNDITAAGHTVTLDSSAGGEITQLAGVVTAGSLVTKASGGTILNDANQVGSFNATDTNGAVSLTNTASPLTLAGVSASGGAAVTINNTGGITITGTVSAPSGGAVNLTSTDLISETGAGLISTTGTLTTTSGTGGLSGGQALNGANTVGTFNATNTTSGDIALNNTAPAQELTVTGVSQTGGGVTIDEIKGLNLTGTVSAGIGAINLTAGVALRETGAGLVSTGGTLTTSSSGGTALDGANAVGSFNATNTPIGDISLTNTATTLTITGVTNSAFPGGAVTINQTGALSLTGTLGVAGGGSVDLTTTGAGNGITLGGGISVPFGTVTLNSAGGISQTPPINTGSLAVTAAGPVSLLDANTATTLAFDISGAGNGFAFRNDSTSFTVGTVGAVIGGTTSSGAIGLSTTTGGNITIGEPIAAGSAAVTLTSAGSVSETSPGAITAGTLTGSSVGGATLGQSNVVGTFGPWSNTKSGSLVFVDTVSMTTAGTVSNTGGGISLETTGSGNNLALGGPVTASGNTVTLTAGLSGTSSTLTQDAGAIITADTLTLSTRGGATLNAANKVGTLTTSVFPINTASISFTDAAPLSVGFTQIFGTGDLTLTTTGAGSNMTLAGTISLLGATSTATFNAAGTISQTGGTIIANTLAGSSVGGASFDFADNSLNNFGPFSDTGGGAIVLRDAPASSLTIAGPITTSGDVSIFVETGGGGGLEPSAGGLSTSAAVGDPDININSAISSGGTVLLSADGNIVENVGGSITATNLIAVTELTAGGAITLDQAVGGVPVNQVGGLLGTGTVTLASRDDSGTVDSSGAIRFSDAGGFTVAAASPTVPIGDVFGTLSLPGISTSTLSAGATVNAGGTGNLTIAAGATVSGNTVTLGTNGNFTNNAGAGAIAVGAGKSWLVYSTDPNDDNDGGLIPNFIQYGAAYAPSTLIGTAPAAGATGDGFLYSVSPTITLTGVTKVYDGGTAVPTTSAAYTDTGALAGDTVTLDFGTVAGDYASKNAGTGIDVTLTALPTITSAKRGAITIFGSGGAPAYTVNAVSAAPIGTITPAPLTVTAATNTKTYDGTTSAAAAPTVTAGTLFDGATLSEAYAAADAGTGLTLNPSIVIADGNGGKNYTVSLVANTSGVINPAPLTAAITGNPTKTYDGTTAATLTSGNYALTGFVAGQGATVTQPNGTYASANAGAGIGVTASLDKDDFAAKAGTLLSNYTLPTSASGTGTINPAVLTAALTGNPTKDYDATTAATLTGANYSLTGFVAGQGATVTQTRGTYASANAGAGIGVTASLAAGDFTAKAGTVLSNYTLPTSAAGTGTISPAELAVAIVGNPTKTYDGTTAATLTGANYSLTGFVGGQGASVTQTAGTYASANAGTGIGVTASLAAGDFTANAGTLLSNYTLPTSAAGTGTINPAALTAAITGNPTKDYDATTAATLTSANYSLTGFVAGQGATVTQTSGTYASANAGTGIGVSASLGAANFTAKAGTLLSNYTLPTSATGTGTISPAELTATIVGNPTKTYDGTTVATLAGANYSLSGFVAGQGATVTQTSGAYASANAGSGIGVSASLGAANFTANAGTLLSNYTLPTSAAGTGTINTAALTITAGDQSKTYGQTLALGTTGFTATGLIAGDSVSGVTLASAGTPATANVGSYAINPSAAIGSGLANYTITFVSGALTVNPAVLTAGLTGTIGKVYDGTTAANGLLPGNYTLSGVVNGDNVGLNNPSSGTYASANAGTGITVSVSGLALTGSAAGNYVLAGNTLSGPIGTITPAQLVAGLTGVVRKPFDGNTIATLTPANYTLSGLVNGDGIVLVAPSLGSYASPDVGTGIPVTATGLGIAGFGAGNYVLASTSVTGNIGEIFGLPTPQVETVTPPQPLTKFDTTTLFIPFAGNFACIPAAGAQKNSNTPLLSGFGVSDTTGNGFTLLDQPYAAAEMVNGSLQAITISPCEVQTSFGAVLSGLGGSK